MRTDTITHPALLARPGAFAREAARLHATTHVQGLFDLPLPRVGPVGLTDPEAEAVRSFEVLGAAFNLHPAALAEWQRMFALDEFPSFEGALLRIDADVLRDLMLRTRTLAQYRAEQPRGAAFMRIWKRARRLQELLDRFVFELAADAYGSDNVPGEFVGWVASSRKLYEELAKRAPQLVRLMPSVHRHPDAPKSLGGMRELRAWLMSHGLTAQGWRWVVEQEPPFVHEDAWKEGRAMFLTIGCINAFAAAGRDFAPSQLFARHAWHFACDADEVWPLERIGWFLREAWLHCSELAGSARREFVEGEFMETCCWIMSTQWQPDANQRRRGWTAIVNAFKADIARHERGWPVPFTRADFDGFTVHALATPDDLLAEGEAMNHCIANYAGQSHCGLFIAFSLRDGEDCRIATFSFRRGSAGEPWALDACCGWGNEEVDDPRVLGAVRATLESVNSK